MRYRGVALILTLAAVTSLTAVLGILVANARTTTLDSELSRLELVAADTFRSSKPILLNWLNHDSHKAIVPPDLQEPKVAISEISWEQEGVPIVLGLTAWDQLGMIPSGIPVSSQLKDTLPGPIKRLLPEVDQQLILRSDPMLPAHPTHSPDGLPLGAYVATHTPQSLSQHRTSSSPILNINTMPKPLLRRALVLAQRADFETVLRNRANQETTPAPPIRQREGSLVSLTGISTLWAIRTDVSVGRITRSWWSVYGSIGSEWTLLEQHEITE